jgi:DNA-binding phage protein
MKLTAPHEPVLAALARAAAAAGLTDTAWARRAGLPKESLSRLKRRSDCDFSTLARLAAALDLDWQFVPRDPVPTTLDGLFPAQFTREVEERLLELAASSNRDADRWRTFGPAFFMAGLAVLLSGTGLWPRREGLALAEALHAGSTEPATFQRWLDRSPLTPERFLPQWKQRLAAY